MDSRFRGNDNFLRGRHLLLLDKNQIKNLTHRSLCYEQIRFDRKISGDNELAKAFAEKALNSVIDGISDALKNGDFSNIGRFWRLLCS